MISGDCCLPLQQVTDGKSTTNRLLTIHLQLSAKQDCHLLVVL